MSHDERITSNSTAPAPYIEGEPDVTNKIIVITGADSGVGFEAGVHLARKGCIIVMCCRDLDKADDARSEMVRRAGLEDPTKVRIVELDLADLDDVESFPVRYERETGDLKDRPIDVIILNAGIMAPHSRTLSKQGFEAQLAINVLGHFKLLAKVFPRIRKAAHGRIVFVGSEIHLMSLGKIDFDDLNRERSYWKWSVYAESKLGALLLVERLNRLLLQHGIDNVLCVGAHPGYAATKIHTHAVAGRWNNLVSQSPDKCAKSYVVAALDPRAERGGYCGPRFVLYGDPAWGSPRLPAVKDEAMQDRFWQACEDMTKAGLEAAVIASSGDKPR